MGGGPASTPRLHIEAIQTVTPAKPAPPGQSRRVSVTQHLVGKLLRGRTHVVAFYERKAAGEDEELRHLMVGWLKESLNAALSEFPVLAGRVWRPEHGVLEVKFSDSGVRLVQAEVDLSVGEFVGSSGRLEEPLLYWDNVDEISPQYSALCYAQMTNFRGKGYSISINCSLLVADPSLVATFFKRWSQIHTTMRSVDRLSAVPIFHYGKLRHPRLASHLTSIPLDVPSPSTTLLFHQPITPEKMPDALAMVNRCLDEAEKTTGCEVPEFCLVAHGVEEEVVVVEPCRREKKDVGGGGCTYGGARRLGWEAMGVEGVGFEEEVELLGVKHGVVFDGGVAVVAVGGNLGLLCAVVSPGK